MIRPQRFLESIHTQIVISAFVGFVSGVYRVIRKQVNTFVYLFGGADVINDAYIKAEGKPFEILTPGRRHQMVSSPMHLEEINRAPVDVLSLHAVAKDFLQPKYTMHGFEWNDVRGVEGTGFVRALRTILTSHLPKLLPSLQERIANHIHRELMNHESSSGSYELSIYDMSKRLVAKTNSFVFFGHELTEDSDFFEAAYSFPHESALAAEAFRLLPNPLARNHWAARSFHDRLHREIERRLSLRSIGNGQSSNDGLQWLIETSPKKNPWSIQRLVGEVMGIWYGSVHTLSIAVTFALLDLYSHKEYIEPLRKELDNTKLDALKGTPGEMPLLDSFLKESARLSAFESTGVRRQALKEFTFSDGLHLRRGDWVCVPHRSLMRDENNFPDALSFHGFRFVGTQHNKDSSNEQDHSSAGIPAKGSFLTDSSDSLIWGLGRIVWSVHVPSSLSWTILRNGSAEAGSCHPAAQIRLRALTNKRREIVSMAVIGDTKTKHKAACAAERQQHQYAGSGVLDHLGGPLSFLRGEANFAIVSLYRS
ncbi:hypothetical protein EPUS_03692 [Endocarpon pusillum Z07020]|uniref:Cytochrome P450 n=1 Tax=Endocarpon pusillum (strain Z07020 / HMAS-L-300199) TaxID=1263415 RepID=U1HHR8_ENDPU|nr:uncharacterized protein EPUS_03692 [Endocarpon pusillum Z07020]ERF69700.1 hypothetical protein EPUS_03692 [Endocarpon pusillum Z07020]